MKFDPHAVVFSIIIIWGSFKLKTAKRFDPFIIALLILSVGITGLMITGAIGLYIFLFEHLCIHLPFFKQQ